MVRFGIWEMGSTNLRDAYAPLLGQMIFSYFKATRYQLITEERVNFLLVTQSAQYSEVYKH